MAVAVSPDLLSVEELNQRLRRVEPAALLVPSRILRRVIKIHHRLGGLGLSVPHHRCYLVDREILLQIAYPSELGVRAESLSAVVFLLPRPEMATRATPSALLLRDYWRRLFHCQVHQTFRSLAHSEEAIGERLRQLDPIIIDEARQVLQQERLLLRPSNDVELFEEFVTTYLELQQFDPEQLNYYFPSIQDHDKVAQVLGEGIDAEAIYQRTRLDGAAESLPAEAEPLADEPIDESNETGSPTALLTRADDASQCGNQVRAAVLYLRVARRAQTVEAEAFRQKASNQIEKLVSRIHQALRFSQEGLSAWSNSLLTLAELAARGGVWNQPMRLLSDLQKVCLDNERELYAADFVEWFITWFHRPLKRSLPDLPLVRTVQHLSRAKKRLHLTQLPREVRDSFEPLLNSVLDGAETQLRSELRPKLKRALEQVGLIPSNVAEQLACEKLIEELLDAIVQRGYLNLGDLRDGIARNRLKLPDLSNPLQILTGDPLIRLNRQLPYMLDGIYHRGEFYRRLLQRLSSLFFGNVLGRLLTLYVILPLLGSLFVLKGVEGIVDEFHHWIVAPLLGLEASHPPEQDETPADAEQALKKQQRPPILPLYNAISFWSLAFFLLLVMHVPPFRRVVRDVLWYLWLTLRGVLYDLPRAFFRLPLVRAILDSRAFFLFFQYVGRPLLWTLPVVLLLRLRGLSPLTLLSSSAVVFCLLTILLNSRLGLLVEETSVDWLSRSWQLIRQDLVPGVFRWLLWLGQRLSERLDKIRYTVEEWLLFRQGQSRSAFWLKLFLGLPWFVVSYLIRFILIVLVEPQINPIKHFPVVTVSHKLMLVIAGPVAELLAPQLGWKFAETFALVTLVFSLIPGLFGFLAWELKENWKLYRANQAPNLEAAIVGGHGEYIINYIRPGFHSGTLPKLFARLRRSHGAKARKLVEGLHHVKQELRHFVERELIATLRQSKHWSNQTSLTVGTIHLATNQIRIELCDETFPESSCWLAFQNRQGKLLAQLQGPGWMASMDAVARSVFANALCGLYKRAGVDQLPSSTQPTPLPFASLPVTWAAWVECWQRDSESERREPLLPGVSLLPA